MLGRIFARFLQLLMLGLPTALAGPAVAEQRSTPVLHLSDAELAKRIAFLDERLEAGRPTALAWQWGWTGLYSVSLVANLAWAIQSEDGNDRVRAIVDAAKSGAATVQMLTLFRDPLPATAGARPMRSVSGSGRAAELQRLAVGERELQARVIRAETRYSLQRHMTVIGANLLGGAAILALGSREDALQSTAIGMAVGEAQIWSQPWRAAGDLRDYHAAFPETGGVAWDLSPRGAGLELTVRF